MLPDDHVATIQQYTEHTTSLYSAINLSLAADAPTLTKHIQALRGAVLQKPLLDDCLLYRGVDLSQKRGRPHGSTPKILHSQLYLNFH